MRSRLFIAFILVLTVPLTGCATPTTTSPVGAWSPSRMEPWDGYAQEEAAFDRGFEKWDEAGDARSTRSSSTPTAGLFDFAYLFYSRYLTQVDGPRCEHRPTCSRYAHQAIRKHGAAIGAWIAVDRLLRANRSSVLRTLPIEKVEEGTIYYRDPVDANDFFL